MMNKYKLIQLVDGNVAITTDELITESRLFYRLRDEAQIKDIVTHGYNVLFIHDCKLRMGGLIDPYETGRLEISEIIEGDNDTSYELIYDLDEVLFPVDIHPTWSEAIKGFKVDKHFPSRLKYKTEMPIEVESAFTPEATFSSSNLFNYVANRDKFIYKLKSKIKRFVESFRL